MNELSAGDLIRHLNQLLLVVVFVTVLARAIRRPRRATIDTALLFGAIALIVGFVWLGELGVPLGPTATAVVFALLMAMPYCLIRLLDDFEGVSGWIYHGSAAVMALQIVGAFATPQPYGAGIIVVYTLYFGVASIYAAVAFARAARRARGVTRRRLSAVALGSVFLGLVILTVGLQAGLPDLSPIWELINPAFTVATGLSYYLGFAPPIWLRRAWQEPELRGFLARAAQLPRLPDTWSITAELERTAAAVVGAPSAAIGLANPSGSVLRFVVDGREWEVPADAMTVGRAFTLQRAQFAPDAPRDNPDWGDHYRPHNSRAVLAAPITAGDQRLGVLAVYAPRAPIFAEDDLALVQLLADEAAVVLESRALIDEAARVRAHAESTRLKDDFLSAAAHDLKTPLTTVVGRVQLLRRRLSRLPDVPAAVAADAEAIAREAERLRDLVVELLDASRVEQGALIGQREDADLVALARDACSRHASDRHTVQVDAPEAVVASVDPARVAQLLDNLVENAVKYSPDGGPVEVTVRRIGDAADITVSDHGIGVAAEDLPYLFDRFRRGRNVDDRRFPGMGLGLYICRGIVEAHGGRIEATSTAGEGTAFRVTLPLDGAARS